MLDLPTILQRCRDVVEQHHPLTMPDLVAAIDEHLAVMGAGRPERPDPEVTAEVRDER